MNRNMKQTITHIVLILLIVTSLASCKKETTYVYNVNDVEVNKPAGEKDNVKQQAEFIAIAYADLTGSNVSTSTLEKLLAPYQAFGDQKLIEQMIINSFLNSPDVNLPTAVYMRADVDVFMTETYNKFYNRDPDEFELWYFNKLITDDGDITPQMVYLAIMTSDEYRYY